MCAQPTKEDMSDIIVQQYKKSSTLERAERIAKRADRLLRFVQLKAPAIVIESARKLVVDAALDFPVDEEAREMWRETNAQIQNDEQEHLKKTGYYDNIYKQLDQDGDQS